jgi:hypothetical protein
LLYQIHLIWEIENYFTSSAANPVELAEINLPFYARVCSVYGVAAVPTGIFGREQNLASLHTTPLPSMHYQTGNKEAIVTKASKLQVKFAGLYQRLTGFPYTVHSPKSTIATS